MHSLNSCSPETFLKVGGAFIEMAAQEKSIDGFVDLLRKDQVSIFLFYKNYNRIYVYYLNKNKMPLNIKLSRKLNRKDSLPIFA